ncbi:MAG: hypothetical protein WCO06_03225, partial [Candidatus Roizmanbacteria bacterium]
MFESTKILHFKKNMLDVYVEKSNKQTRPEVSSQVEWSVKNLEDILKNIPDISQSKIKVIANDDLVYTISTVLEKSIKNEQEKLSSITRISQEYIPEDLASTTWEYNDALIENNGIQEHIVEVRAYTHAFVKALTQSCINIKVAIDSIYAVSEIYSKLIISHEPTLIFYPNDDNFASVVVSGVVLANISFDTQNSLQLISQLIHHVSTHFNVGINKIIDLGSHEDLCTNLLKTNSQISVTKSRPEEYDLISWIGIQKEDSKAIVKTLNFMIYNKLTEENKMSLKVVNNSEKISLQKEIDEKEGNTHNLHNKLSIFIDILLLIFIIGILILLYQFILS